MWQEIIVIIIVLVAAFFVVRHFVRNVKGTRACEIEQCADCPFGEGCDHQEQRPRQRGSGGGGCGCH